MFSTEIKMEIEVLLSSGLTPSQANNEFLRNLQSLRGGSRAAATSKMECFVIIVNGWKHSILDVVAALDPPLSLRIYKILKMNWTFILKKLIDQSNQEEETLIL